MEVLPRGLSRLRGGRDVRDARLPRPFVLAICTLCLACGHVTAAYLRPSRGMQESPATGGVWAPPCPAVQRLRDCVFRPYARLAEEDGESPARWVAAP